MLPTLVFVVLPAETAPTDVETLLAACNQTYVEGECRAGQRGESASSLGAEVTWPSEHRARVQLRFTLRDTARSLTRVIEFKVEDEQSERFRTLGFVVGSMAGGATELVRVDEESAPVEPVAAPTAKAAEAPAPSSPPPTMDGAPVPADIPSPPSEPTEMSGRLRLGALGGSGVDNVRWGGTLGASAIWDRRWLLDVHGSYSAEGGSEVGARFMALGLSLGFETHAGNWSFGATAGPRVVWVDAESDAGAGSLPAAWGAQVGLGLRYSATALCPYLEIDGLIARQDKVLVDSGAIEFEPIQLQFVLGVAFTDVVLRAK